MTKPSFTYQSCASSTFFLENGLGKLLPNKNRWNSTAGLLITINSGQCLTKQLESSWTCCRIVQPLRTRQAWRRHLKRMRREVRSGARRSLLFLIGAILTHTPRKLAHTRIIEYLLVRWTMGSKDSVRGAWQRRPKLVYCVASLFCRQSGFLSALKHSSHVLCLFLLSSIFGSQLLSIFWFIITWLTPYWDFCDLL